MSLARFGHERVLDAPDRRRGGVAAGSRQGSAAALRPQVEAKELHAQEQGAASFGGIWAK
jgi:hypothetical protein